MSCSCPAMNVYVPPPRPAAAGALPALLSREAGPAPLHQRALRVLRLALVLFRHPRLDLVQAHRGVGDGALQHGLEAARPRLDALRGKERRAVLPPSHEPLAVVV